MAAENNASDLINWRVLRMLTQKDGTEVDLEPLIFADEKSALAAARRIIVEETTNEEYEEDHEDDRHIIFESKFPKQADKYVLFTVKIEQPTGVEPAVASGIQDSNASDLLKWRVLRMYTKHDGTEVDGEPLIFPDEKSAVAAARKILQEETSSDEYEEEHNDDRHIVFESNFPKDKTNYCLFTVTVAQPDTR